MTRARHLWKPNKEDGRFLDKVEAMIKSPDYRPFWPLTLRQIYYGLVGDLVIENTKNEYKRLGRLLTLARLSGRISWRAIFDTNRSILTSGGFEDADQFIEQELERFLDGYHRHLSQSQPVAIEIWVEKDAIARVVHKVADEYHLPTVVAKGYSSVSYVNELRRRVEENIEDGRKTLVLYFGDLDPSGVNMLPAMFETLHEEMGVDEADATYERCALNPAQVKRYKLPRSPDALKDDEWQRTRGDPSKKKGDPRAEAYKSEFGKLAVELDAFKPPVLQAVVREAIERHFDARAFAREKKKQADDLKRLQELREDPGLSRAIARLKKKVGIK